MNARRQSRLAAGAVVLLLLSCATGCANSTNPIKGPLNFGAAGTDQVCTEAKPNQQLVLGEEMENDTTQTLVLTSITGHGDKNITTTGSAVMGTSNGGIGTATIPVTGDLRASWANRKQADGFVVKPKALVDIILIAKLKQGTEEGAIKGIAINYTQKGNSQAYRNIGGRSFILTPTQCGP